jgi:hypothetical protein
VFFFLIADFGILVALRSLGTNNPFFLLLFAETLGYQFPYFEVGFYPHHNLKLRWYHFSREIRIRNNNAFSMSSQRLRFIKCKAPPSTTKLYLHFDRQHHYAALQPCN